VAGTPDTYQNLLDQTRELQRRVNLAQADLLETELSGTAGGGLVTVTMRGDGTVTRVAFDQAVFDEGDAESLGGLTLAAIASAHEAVRALAADKVAAVSESFGGALGSGKLY
jgi:nucleoid-associated protein EbfC